MDRLDELHQRYLDALPQKGRDLALQWRRWYAHPQDRSALAELHQHVHRLSGSAPAYGFARIGALAQPADTLIAQWLRDDALHESTDIRWLAQRLQQPIGVLLLALENARETETGSDRSA